VGKVQEVTCGDCGIRYQVPKVNNDTACIACDSKEKNGVRAVQPYKHLHKLLGFLQRRRRRLITRPRGVPLNGSGNRLLSTAIRCALRRFTFHFKIRHSRRKDRFVKRARAVIFASIKPVKQNFEPRSNPLLNLNFRLAGRSIADTFPQHLHRVIFK
jgi:hypothetical protein